MYAAAGLLLATGDRRFCVDFDKSYQPLQNDPSYLRSNVYAALLYLRASAGDPERQLAIRADLRRRADEVRWDGERHPFQWAGRTFWGSIAAGFQRTAGFSAPICLDDPFGAAADCEQVLANVHYALGRNYQQIAYVSGLPGVSRGRTHAFHHWLAALDASPYLFPGLVAGGPIAAPEPADVSVPHGHPVPIWGYWNDPAMPRDDSTPVEGRYTDNDSWSTNELDIDWQGVTQPLLRAMVGRRCFDERHIALLSVVERPMKCTYWHSTSWNSPARAIPHQIALQVLSPTMTS
jgi:hypothetical protein